MSGDPYYERAQLYERAHGREAAIVRAAEIAEQRKSGRALGPNIYVDWEPGLCQIADIYGRWLEIHGPASGVYVRRIK